MSFLFMSPSYSQEYVDQYPVGLHKIYDDVLINSEELKSLWYVHQSQLNLLDGANKYRYPKVRLTSDYKDFYGQNGQEQQPTSEMILDVTSNLISNTAKHRIKTASRNAESASIDLIKQESLIYFDILEQLLKVSINRNFVADSQSLKDRINRYTDKIKNAVELGTAPQSHLRESRLVKVRFDDILTSVDSEIKNLFTELTLKTGYEVEDQSMIGLSRDQANKIMNLQFDFDVNNAVQLNLNIKAQSFVVSALKSNAKAQDQKYTLSVFNTTKVSQKNVDAARDFTVQDDSELGVRLLVNLFDVDRETNVEFAMNSYKSEQALLDDQIEKLKYQVEDLAQRYDKELTRVGNLENQIFLSNDLILSQEKEILIDRTEYIDMMKSISELTRTRSSLLQSQISLAEVIIAYLRIIDLRVIEKSVNDDYVLSHELNANDG